jgi:GTP-binding protein
MTLPIRNVAIIAHVDHGKTTLVDALLQAVRYFSREGRGGPRPVSWTPTTWSASAASPSCRKIPPCATRDTLINIVDTPGHADFGGEVERVLGMVDGCILIVDANEGPMPQTRFVLKKALEKGTAPHRRGQQD